MNSTLPCDNCRAPHGVEVSWLFLPSRLRDNRDGLYFLCGSCQGPVRLEGAEERDRRLDPLEPGKRRPLREPLLLDGYPRPLPQVLLPYCEILHRDGDRLFVRLLRNLADYPHTPNFQLYHRFITEKDLA